MMCPHCKSKSVYCREKRNNFADNENYRKFQCHTCKNMFFTVEFEAEKTPEFLRQWSAAERKKRNG